LSKGKRGLASNAAAPQKARAYGKFTSANQAAGEKTWDIQIMTPRFTTVTLGM
jgi:hypothetical protein